MYMLLLCTIMLLFTSAINAQDNFQADTIGTSEGNLVITFLGHGTLMFTFGGKVIHVDPWSRVADYSKLPKADIILVTHEHFDHLDTGAIERIRSDSTSIICTALCKENLKNAAVMKIGDKMTVNEFEIEAVPAYNILHQRNNGNPYHPKGDGNGYIIAFGDKRVYVAGDTENTPEMKSLENIDIAFLPMNLPYTMTPEMVADAARALRPSILYPYHYGDTDTSIILKLLEDEEYIEVRIRDMK